MPLEVDDVRAWLLDLRQEEAAALLSEAEFEYTFLDSVLRMDSVCADCDILELTIRVPPRIYRDLNDLYAKQADQVVAAVSEMSSHTTDSWIKETLWSARFPTLEDVESTPDTDELFENAGLSDVQRLWTKAKARVLDDPDGAITAANTMLESLCKNILNESGIACTGRDDLPALYRKVLSQMNLGPAEQAEEEYRKLSGASVTIVHAVAGIRNRASDSHAAVFQVGPAHAKFVVNLAGSLSAFLVGVRRGVARATRGNDDAVR